MKQSNRAAKAGFTLVELIVVIAILGILAGVGAVSYNGYIKKANKAADDVLLDAVNMALSASCSEEKTSPVNLADASLPISSTGTGSLTVSPASEEISTAFSKYFAGNETTAWKHYIALRFNKEAGMFVGVEPLSDEQQEAVAAFLASNFSGNQEELLAEMDRLAAAFASKDFQALFNLMGSQAGDYQNFLAGMGIDMENPDGTALANATILYVAKLTSNLSGSDANDHLNSLIRNFTANGSTLKTSAGTYDGNKVMNLLTNNGTEDMLTNSALLYGISLGYLNSGYASDAAKSYAASHEVTGMSSMIDYFMGVLYADNGVSFTQYCNAESGGVSNDIDGYLGAMGVLNDYSDLVNIENENALSDPEILALINAIFGGGN